MRLKSVTAVYEQSVRVCESGYMRGAASGLHQSGFGAECRLGGARVPESARSLPAAIPGRRARLVLCDLERLVLGACERRPRGPL